MLIALNLNPPDSETNYLKRLIDPKETGFFTINTLEKVVLCRVKDVETLKNLLSALKAVFASKNFADHKINNYKS